MFLNRKWSSRKYHARKRTINRKKRIFKKSQACLKVVWVNWIIIISNYFRLPFSPVACIIKNCSLYIFITSTFMRPYHSGLRVQSHSPYLRNVHSEKCSQTEFIFFDIYAHIRQRNHYFLIFRPQDFFFELSYSASVSFC